MKIKFAVNSEAVQARFWARTFKLEADIEEVRKLMEGADNPRAFASMPVINEFKIDSTLEFAYVLLFTVDVMGPSHVIGMIFLYDAPNKEEVIQVRDQLADEVLDEFHKRHEKVVASGKGEFVDQLKVVSPGGEEETGPSAKHERPPSAPEGPPDPDL